MAADQIRDNSLPKIFQMLLFPHKKRIVGCQLIQDHRDFISVLLFQQVCHEIRKAGIPHLSDGWGQAAGNQLTLAG